MLELAKCCWAVYNKLDIDSPDESLNITNILKPLDINQRAAIACVDILNLSYPLAGIALKWNTNEIINHIVAARKIIIANK